RHVLQVLEKALEPTLQIQSIPEDEIGVLGLHDVERSRLIAVDLRAWLGDAFDYRRRTGDVLGDVLNVREGGDDTQWLAPAADGLLRLKTATWEKAQGKRDDGRTEKAAAALLVWRGHEAPQEG